MARAHARRWLWWLLAPALLLAALASPLACATSIRPPDSPPGAVAVFVIDYGTTSALALPAGDRLEVYAYGDWQYYALRHTSVPRGVAALAWPTRGALGRASLRPSATPEAVLAQFRGRGAEDVHVVRVAAAAAERLRQRLDDQYRQRQETEVRNPEYGMSFVHHPQQYTWFWNSNHQVAAWLEELGCGVRGPAFASRWRVEGG